jgi:c-di-GMP-binding flagellar brake protein YcgR
MIAPSELRPLELEDAERFEVRERVEVLAVLRALVERRAPLIVHFGDRGEFMLSSLLAANPEFEELVFDCSGDEEANERLVGASRIDFVSQLDRVRIQFGATSAERILCEDLPALRARIPETLVRLQRREDYRIAAPLVRPLLVRLPHPHERGRSVELRVLDLSRGGIAVADAPPRVPLEAGLVLEGCSLPLPEAGRVGFDAEVSHLMPTGAANGTTRCGLRFLDLRGATLAQIQRLVLRLERNRGVRS